MVKKYKVVISAEARLTLLGITNYVRRKDSATKAKYVRTELLKAANKLGSLPNSHPVFYESSKSGNIYRYLSKWQYKIIFTVKEAKNRVIVVQLFHDKQDPDLLKSLLP